MNKFGKLHSKASQFSDKKAFYQITKLVATVVDTNNVTQALNDISLLQPWLIHCLKLLTKRGNCATSQGAIRIKLTVIMQ